MDLKKLTLLLMLFTLVALPAAFADIQVEISTDNTTFFPVNSTAYEGDIDEINILAHAQILNPNTQYYVRVKNETTDWAYASFKTEDDVQMGVPAVLLGFIFGGLLLLFTLLLIFQKPNKIVAGIYWSCISLLIIFSMRVASMFVEGMTNGIDSTVQAAIVSALDSFYSIGISIFLFLFALVIIGMLFASIFIFKNLAMRKKIARTKWERKLYGSR